MLKYETMMEICEIMVLLKLLGGGWDGWLGEIGWGLVCLEPGGGRRRRDEERGMEDEDGGI